MSTQYQSKEHSSEQSKQFSEHSKQQYSEDSKQQFSDRSKQQFSGDSKQQFSEHSKEFSREKTDVTVEKIVNPPVVLEHHHHHTHTIVHPEIVREHNTSEIRQVIQPIHEHVKEVEKEEYAGKEVRFVDKRENTAEALKKREANQRDIQAKANITHTEDKTSSVDSTKVTDVHSKHKVIEEVTPVIIRDVEHNKTIHKDEKQVERIYHAPEVHKEELGVQHKEGLSMDTHGLKEGYTTKGSTELKEGHTTKGSTEVKEGYSAKSSTGIKEGYSAKSSTGIKEGYSAKSSTGIKEGHAQNTPGFKLFNKEEQKSKGTTTGINNDQIKADRIRKGVE